MAETKPSVLLVDDVEANLIALEALLEGMGCEIVRASGGNEALKHLLKHDFAVMLLDVQMPHMDGYEVARHARGNPVTQHVPIIFLTAKYYTEESVLRGYGTGAVDYLLKPVSPYLIRAKVKVFLDLYLGRKRLMEEIAAHKKTVAALELANTALRHFTNAASHDLRAPLRAMRGFLGALAEDAGGQLDPGSRDYLERSIRASHRMDSLLSSLLVYARLQRPPSRRSVPCGALLEQVSGDLAQQLAKLGAVLRVGDLPSVKGDPDRLYQLFLNLVSNAVKFRRPERPNVVRVNAELGEGEAIFCVQDDGIGIADEHQCRIFEGFCRLQPERQYEGSGLGLAICKQIVEEHGGRIWVESEPGIGSRFFFTLPLAAPPA